jgi:predicted nucleic acid-binding protein
VELWLITSGCRPERRVTCRSRRSVEADIVGPHATRKRFWLASGRVFAIVDTGPLYAAVDADDIDHARCVAALGQAENRLVIPALVVAEATYLVGSRLGAKVEARFLRRLREMDVEAPNQDDWIRIGDLVERYADFPLGGTDASVVALAERLATEVVFTLDRRHFAAVRPKHVKALRLLP